MPLIVLERKLMNKKYINAFIIGFMVAVLVWGIAKNNIGLFTLIPLFIIYKIVNNSRDDKKLEK